MQSRRNAWGQKPCKALRSLKLSSVMTSDGPCVMPLPWKASVGITLPIISNPFLMVFSCSSEVIMTPSGIPVIGVHVDKINTEVLNRSREDVESQKTKILRLGEGFGGLGPSVGCI